MTSFITTDLDRHFKRLRKQGAGLPDGPPPTTQPAMIGSEEPYHLPSPEFMHSSFGSYNRKVTKTAAGSVQFSQPTFFSPVYTPINWQIPSKRREIYQWTVVDGQLLLEDFTYTTIEDYEIESSMVVEDKLTGGVLFEGVEAPPVVSGSGCLRVPAKFGVRDCEKKPSYRFKATGNWRRFSLTEEHNVLVVDGKLWRRIKKADSDRKYRRSKGVPAGTDRIERPDHFIVRKESKDVEIGDFVLTPIPDFGNGSIDPDLAHLVGLVAADGSVFGSSGSNGVSITVSADERFFVAGLLDDIGVKYGSGEHSNSNNSWRFVLSQKGEKWHSFMSKYICGKLIAKKFTREVFQLDRETMLCILAGYIDGDGSFRDCNPNLIINTNSRDMADQLFMMFLMCGMKASVGRYLIYNDNFNSGTEWSYRVMVPNSNLGIIAPYLRSGKIDPNFVPKKERDLRFFHEEDGARYLASPIESVEGFLYTGKGWDLQIDPERRFVLSGHVVSNCRFFYENEPRVAAALDFYARYPMSSGFEIECKDRHVKNYFDNLNKKLDLERWLRLISHEVHLMGDCFPFLEVGCDICGGADPLCDHEGGSFKRLIVLNPDFIEVFTNPLTPNNSIMLIPDDELKDLVRKNGPGAENLSDDISNMVMAGQPIPLDNLSVSHLKYGESPYRRYGISMIRRLFPILAYKTKLMTAQWIVAERMIIPIKIVKVGTEERPASEQDIANVQTQLSTTANDPNLVIVTHHAFDVEWVGAGSQVLQLSTEWDFINQEILDGLGINQMLLNGEGPVYSSAAIGAEVMIQRLEDWRRELRRWVERHIYLPVAKMKGFIEKNEWGEQEYIVPKIKWNSLNLRDVNQERQMILNLFDKGLISRKRVLDEFDIDPDTEAEQMRYERVEAMTEQPMGGEEGGMGGMGGMEGGLGGAPLDMGGGLGGEMGGMGGEMGGEMGGMGGEMGGDMGAGLGEAAAASGAPQIANVQEYGGKVLSKRTREKLDKAKENKEVLKGPDGKPLSGDGFERDEQGRIYRTSIEIAILKGLEQRARIGRIHHRWHSAFEVKGPGRQPYIIDIAFPTMKVGVEADGEMFHSGDEQEKKDKERDAKLAQMGWTVIRFRDRDIEKNLPRVLDEIEKTLDKKEHFLRTRGKSRPRNE